MEPVASETFDGGNMNAVQRIGGRVHRTAGPQTLTIHRLLAHVRAQGVTWVPEPHGFDAEGREVLDFLPGDVVHDLPEWLWSEEVLDAVARALREWHDATANFPRTDKDVWWQEPLEPQEVICHIDFAPYNHVFREGAFVGAIDFDLCTPGPRVWDLAYMAYRYVPLTPHVDDAVADGDSWGRSQFSHRMQRHRLDRCLRAYRGIEGREGSGEVAGPDISANDVLAVLPARLFAMADWCDVQDDADLRRNGVMYRAHGEWIAAGGLADTLDP